MKYYASTNYKQQYSNCKLQNLCEFFHHTETIFFITSVCFCETILQDLCQIITFPNTIAGDEMFPNARALTVFGWRPSVVQQFPCRSSSPPHRGGNSVHARSTTNTLETNNSWSKQGSSTHFYILYPKINSSAMFAPLFIHQFVYSPKFMEKQSKHLWNKNRKSGEATADAAKNRLAATVEMFWNLTLNILSTLIKTHYCSSYT